MGFPSTPIIYFLTYIFVILRRSRKRISMFPPQNIVPRPRFGDLQCSRLGLHNYFLAGHHTFHFRLRGIKRKCYFHNSPRLLNFGDLRCDHVSLRTGSLARACENIGERSEPRVAWGENECTLCSFALASLAISA